MRFNTHVTALLVTAALCTGFNASAQDAGSASANRTGPYVGLGLGLVDTPSTDVTDTTKRKVKFDNGKMGALFGGYAYGNGWRLEGELSRRDADVKSIDGTTGSGDLKTTSLMANVLYDFDINAPVTPYLGFGAGLSRVKFDNASPFGASSINDTDNALALQGIAGASYAMNENLDLFADYRYFTARNVSMRTAAGTSASFDTRNHAIMVGLRYSFGAPKAHPKPTPKAEPAAMVETKPMPAPAPAPDFPRNYIVFFDWDRADITPEAANIIQAAARNANAMNVVRLELTGHADRSGSDRYNLKLSQRRGDAVRAVFSKLGFKPGEISVVAKGETDPLVPTDDGVREPQNRRVEIILP